MELNKNNHYSFLKESYDKVGKQTWNHSDFQKKEISISRSYYTDKSLLLRKPSPKNLEVYALLSGLPFSTNITEKLISVQNEITKILGESLHYWVKPNNFGLEYCVFKWPDDDWNSSYLPIIKEEISFVESNSFLFHIHGIQINPDGCVVAKGYDENGVIFDIRRKLKEKLYFLPDKQSEWAHIPMGRILEPVGALKFSKLNKFIDKVYDEFIVSDVIDSLSLVHENRWYMEERSILQEYKLYQ